MLLLLLLFSYLHFLLSALLALVTVVLHLSHTFAQHKQDDVNLVAQRQAKSLDTASTNLSKYPRNMRAGNKPFMHACRSQVKDKIFHCSSFTPSTQHSPKNRLPLSLLVGFRKLRKLVGSVKCHNTSWYQFCQRSSPQETFHYCPMYCIQSWSWFLPCCQFVIYTASCCQTDALSSAFPTEHRCNAF